MSKPLPTIAISVVVVVLVGCQQATTAPTLPPSHTPPPVHTDTPEPNQTASSTPPFTSVPAPTATPSYQVVAIDPDSFYLTLSPGDATLPSMALAQIGIGFSPALTNDFALNTASDYPSLFLNTTSGLYALNPLTSALMWSRNGQPQSISSAASVQRLVASYPDGSMVLLNAMDGQQVATFAGVDDVSWSPDGYQFAAQQPNDASASTDHIAIYDSVAGHEIDVLTVDHREGLSFGDVEWSPDGTLIAGCRFADPDTETGSNGDILVWDTATAELLYTVSLPDSAPGIQGDCILSFSPDGVQLAESVMAAYQTYVGVIDLNSGDRVYDTVFAAAYEEEVPSPAEWIGGKLAIRSQHDIQMLDPTAGFQIQRLDIDTRAWAISPQQDRIALATGEGFEVLDTATLLRQYTINMPEYDPIWDQFLWSPDSAWLVVFTGGLTVFDGRTGGQILDGPALESLLCQMLFIDDHQLVLLNSYRFVLIDLSERAIRNGARFSPQVNNLTWSADSEVLLFTASEGAYPPPLGSAEWFWSATTGDVMRGPYTGASETGTPLMVSYPCLDCDTLQWTSQDGSLSAEVTYPDCRGSTSPTCVLHSGSEIELRDANGSHLWSQSYDSAITALALSPDGASLAVGFVEQPITLIEPQSGQVLSTLGSSIGYPEALLFSPDRSKLASVADGSVIIWDTSQ